VRVEEGGISGADHYIAFVDEVEGASCGHAMHGGDHGLPALIELWADIVAGVMFVPYAGRRGALLADIDAGAEGSSFGGSEENRIDLGVRLNAGP